MKSYSEILSPSKKTNSFELVESIILDIYRKLPHNQVASIIEKYNDIQVTNTLVEKYIELASSREFTLDPVAFELRKLNKFDYNFLEDKIEFVLEDNSTILISEKDYLNIKEVLESNQEAIDYLKNSKENFLKMLEIIQKYKSE
jgi:hypothetical protein